MSYLNNLFRAIHSVINSAPMQIVGLLMLGLFLCSGLSAQESSDPQAKPVDLSAVVQSLSELWLQVEGDADRADFSSIPDKIAMLTTLRDQVGISGLPEYSNKLLQRGEKFAAEGRYDNAQYFYRWALRLSPESPEILWRIVPVAYQVKVDSVPRLISRAFKNTLHSPFQILRIVQLGLYPLLLSLTVSLMLCFIVLVAKHIMEIFRVLAWKIRPGRRGWGIPLAFLTLFGLPLCLGFLWCLVLWSVVLYFLLPEKRFFSCVSAIAVVAWGVFIPLRENIATWVSGDEVRRVIVAREQPLTIEERSSLSQEMKRWSDDTVVQFKYAQLLRGSGELGRAESVLDDLEAIQGQPGWLLAERGVLHYIKGDSSTAEKVLRQALEEMPSSAAILFNLSKVAFERNNTKESRDLFGQALKQDKAEVEKMQKREEMLGIHNPRSFADVEMPYSQYLSAALIPNAESFGAADRYSRQLMWGSDPRIITIMGVLVLLMHLIPHRRARRITQKGMYDGYSPGTFSEMIVYLIPAGKLIAIGRYRVGLFAMISMMIIAAPLLVNVYSEQGMLAHCRWMMPYHCCFVALTYLSIWFYSVLMVEE